MNLQFVVCAPVAIPVFYWKGYCELLNNYQSFWDRMLIVSSASVLLPFVVLVAIIVNQFTTKNVRQLRKDREILYPMLGGASILGFCHAFSAALGMTF